MTTAVRLPGQLPVSVRTSVPDSPGIAVAVSPGIGAQPNGPLIDGVLDEYKEYTGRDAREDFPLWEPCHRHILGSGAVGFENVGGQIDEVTGKRVTFAAFPWRWTQGDGCIVRLVAILDPTGEFRIETGD